ncbi:FecR domain-containing protein [Rhizorhabdus wittichii]|uniref:FecR domain-containing protein n=1 Tax=Rhizorhabdus wittichii TaxID=160791 RepID=A0A975D3B6_9SPHN|nr:FecR domain-containing protein [Rhizorhabdus wittichii]QTH22157.1 FecR domain-containing protein [Rhizorhabdus wittichii]
MPAKVGRSWFFLPVAALLAAAPLAAQPAAEPMLRYTVRPNDTLSALARDFLVGGDYREVQRLNKVADPYRMPIGSILLIPDRLLRTEPVVGKVVSFRGSATIDGRQAALGGEVRQGMRVETGANASIAIAMPDGSTIALPSQSRILVDRLRRILLTDGLDRNFRLETGRSRSSVIPMKDPASNFRVTTPLSVAAVRGTEFRVAVDKSGERALTEVVAGTVGVAAGPDPAEVAVPRGYGAISTPAGTEPPVALLPPPKLLQLEKTETGVSIVAERIEGAKAYRVELATDVAFLNIIEEAQSDEPSISLALPQGATFFVRLTAIATSGLEGLPGIYAPGVRRSAPPPAPASGPSADAGAAEPLPFRLWAEPRPLPIRLTGHGLVQPRAIAAHTPLR